jgi:periplasmic protein TonB
MRSHCVARLSLFLAAALQCVTVVGAAKDQSKNGVTAPKPIYTPDPEYTDAARRDKIQGVAVVKLSLDVDGVPHDIKILRSLRSDLDVKAVEAVAKWRFEPARKDGVPVAMPLTVEVSFRLH